MKHSSKVKIGLVACALVGLVGFSTFYISNKTSKGSFNLQPLLPDNYAGYSNTNSTDTEVTPMPASTLEAIRELNRKYLTIGNYMNTYSASAASLPACATRVIDLNRFQGQINEMRFAQVPIVNNLRAFLAYRDHGWYNFDGVRVAVRNNSHLLNTRYSEASDTLSRISYACISRENRQMLFPELDRYSSQTFGLTVDDISRRLRRLGL